MDIHEGLDRDMDEGGKEMEEETGKETGKETGVRRQDRDHALARLDEKEVKARMVDAFDAFIEMGFEVSLIGVKQRDSIVYKLVLAEDGADDIPLREIQAVADTHRMDVFFERGRGLSIYARW